MFLVELIFEPEGSLALGGQGHGTIRGPVALDRERGSVGLGQAFHDAGTVPFRHRFAEMDDPQLGHELTLQLRAAGGKQFGSHPQPLRGRAVV